MINKLFKGYKFTRTYIGGSKQVEADWFEIIGGIKKDASDCDWVEYKRLLTLHFDDLLHVLLTWKDITLKISLGLLLGGIMLFQLLISFFVLIGLSLIFMIIHLIFKYKEKNKLLEYNLCITVSNFKIEELYGIQIQTEQIKNVYL